MPKKHTDLDSRVDHPAHYNQHPTGIECIDVIEHFSFNVGNAIKYLWRAAEGEDWIVDLQKAIWYVQRELDRAKVFEKDSSCQKSTLDTHATQDPR